MAGLSRKNIQKIVNETIKTYEDRKGINHIEGKNLPSRKIIYEILDDIFGVLFPGYVNETDITWAEIPYFVGDKVNSIYVRLIEQCARALRYECKFKVCKPTPTDECKKNAESATCGLLLKLPKVRNLLKEDVEAAYDGDPAAKSFDEIILSYPCIEAIATYRVAHLLYESGIPLIPRILSERAHSHTGIDIHPGAKIGRHFFIDHGTGVVVGETSHIGNHVKLYQGVTLGALSFPKDERGRVIKGGKRHPTLEDHVTVYSQATILGGETVIGKNSVIGGNVWITQSIPANSHVTMSDPNLVIHRRK